MACCCGALEPPTRPVLGVPVCTLAPPTQLTPPSHALSFSRKPLPPGCQRFAYRELQGATGDFADNALLGEGGFGRVYRGTLEGGTAVAVKCLDRLGLQGEKEFGVEVLTLGRLRHPNLVTLLGACTEDQHRLVVFDFMPGGSLRDNLDHKPCGHHTWHAPRAHLLWPARLGIALGAARGLGYLHEGTDPGLIHRDVKSSNVLIDTLGHARIADFGLAMQTGTSSGPTAASYEAQPTTDTEMLTGTFGYSAPEYIEDGRTSQKSDVYSFGVILLELLTGRQPVDPTRPPGSQVLVDEMLPVMREGDIPALQAHLDPVMPAASVPVPQLAAFSEVAFGCLRADPRARPRMQEVINFLESIANWKESLPARNQGGRHTLLSLMDAVAEVPPISASDVLTSVVSYPSTSTLPGVERQVSYEQLSPAGGALPDRYGQRAMVADRRASPDSEGPAQSSNTPKMAFTSFGPGSWPSMPLTPSAPASPSSNSSPAAMGVADGSLGLGYCMQPRSPLLEVSPNSTAAPASASSLKDPIAAGAQNTSRLHNGEAPMHQTFSTAADWSMPLQEPQAAGRAAPEDASGTAGAWVSFDQPHTFASGRQNPFPSSSPLWASPAADPAHLRTVQAMQGCRGEVVLTPRRPPPPPPLQR